jgi:MoxR-like ATPase
MENMINKIRPEYKYDENCQPPKEGVKDKDEREYFPYRPNPKLVKAVNLAIQLNRPLLIEGESGVGKTRLADALAYHFSRQIPGQESQVNPETWWEYHCWTVKSNSQAREGFYRFDAVARLRDAQLVGAIDAVSRHVQLGGAKPEELDDLKKELNEVTKRIRDNTRYVEFGKLGKALEAGKTLYPLILIDEIDKADGDFCNDLLVEIERQYFEIPEIGNKKYPEAGKLQPKPIVIITSNQERQLPEPFLRRCLYYYLEFPQTEELERIIYSRFGEKNAEQRQYVADTIAHFYEIRNLLKGKPGSKPPGTSELLDYLEIHLAKDSEDRDVERPDLETLAEEPHLLGIILKTQADQELYRKHEGFEYGDSQ